MTNNALDPQPDVRVTEVRTVRREGDGRTLWIVLGLVAVVAIIALVLVFNQNSGQVGQQAALNQAVAQQQTVDAASQAGASANSAALAAGQAASAAGDAATRATQSAAQSAANSAKTTTADTAQPEPGDAPAQQ